MKYTTAFWMRRYAARRAGDYRPAASPAKCHGACCATRTADQSGIPAGIDATIVGEVSEGSASGRVATTGNIRMIASSRAMAKVAAPARPATAIRPAAMAEYVPSESGRQFQCDVIPPW